MNFLNTSGFVFDLHLIIQMNIASEHKDLYFSNVNHGGGSSNSALLLAWEGQSSGSSIKHYRPTDLKATGFGGS